MNERLRNSAIPCAFWMLGILPGGVLGGGLAYWQRFHIAAWLIQGSNSYGFPFIAPFIILFIVVPAGVIAGMLVGSLVVLAAACMGAMWEMGK